jgi:hypothetical protein
VIDAFEDVTGSPLFEPGTFANGDPKPADVVQEEWIGRQWWIPKTGWLTFSETDWPISIWLKDEDEFTENTWNPLASTNLADGALGWPPEGWRDRDYARRRHREDWCERRNIDLRTCESVDVFDAGEAQALRRDWCSDNGVASHECESRFRALARDFQVEWEKERESYLSQQLDDPDQVGRDLRRADLSNAFLADANLRRVRLEGANLAGAQLEGANLADARLEGTNLALARLDGANLAGARLKGARLVLGRLDGAILADANMEGADLFRASLVGAILRWARLEGTNLFQAELEGADLRWTDLRSSSWDGASIGTSLAESADLRGGRDMTQAQLEDLIGNEDTLLPDGPSDTGEPFFVWSCWETPPPEFERIVATAAGFMAPDFVRAALRAEFVCGPGNPRRKTGTPLALDAPYPEGHPLAGRD